MDPIDVLLIEDTGAHADLIRERLANVDVDFDVVHVETLADALDRLAQGRFDVILTDLGLPDSDGLDTLVEVRDAQPSAPIVVLTALNDQEAALDALRMGAHSFLVKGRIDDFALAHALRSAVEVETDKALRRVLARAREERSDPTVASLIGGLSKEIHAASSYLDNALARIAQGQGDLDEAVQGVRQIDRLASAMQRLVKESSPETVDVSLHEPAAATLYVFETFKPDSVTVSSDLGDTPPVLVKPIRLQQAILDMLVKVADGIEGPGALEVVTHAPEGDDVAYIRVSAESRDGEVQDPKDMAPVRDVVHDHGGKLGKRRESPAHLSVAMQLPLADVDDLAAES